MHLFIRLYKTIHFINIYLTLSGVMALTDRSVRIVLDDMAGWLSELKLFQKSVSSFTL